MRVYICADDNFYGGLHGMNSQCITDVYDIEEADAIGREMSLDVIESYSDITDEIDSQVEAIMETNDDCCEDDVREEVLGEDTNWLVWENNEEIAGDLTIQQLEELLEAYIDKEFISKYCKKVASWEK